MSRFWVASVHRVFLFLAICHLAASLGFSGTPPKRRHRRVVKPAAHRTATARVAKTGVVQPVAYKKATATKVATPVIAGGPWTSPTYADSTDGDNIDGEDLDVRRAAVEALGSYNGSVVVVDPGTGRILSMVNQRVALGSGFQPCSTVKLSVALAGLSEKVIQESTRYRMGGLKMDLTYALAHSNNSTSRRSETSWATNALPIMPSSSVTEKRPD